MPNPSTNSQPPIVLRIAIAAAVLVASWYGMMATHELGHVLAGLATGGSITSVAIPLLGFSHTAVSPNPHPLIVVWAGAIFGVLLPLLFWGAARLALKRGRTERLLRFFAGFCCLANGVYLGLGWIDRIGDTHELLLHGAKTWQLTAFGIVCTAAAFTLWHGLGPWMGLGTKDPPTPRG